ncbi:alpha/beta hydrolase [Corynebacterium sp. HFH0082]|uniref:alpha/beta hydrolase n=1 Tax=Corynebacterium sp. HFH0082 TaxID=1078764 RepID=UPI00034E3F72|nr:alpha/beta hydrolase [Corynebacterium sp. HFH0082]EPD47813.1 hypothetical protein HMPREF1206_01121 [Corynebacterium sp. HFH0082]
MIGSLSAAGKTVPASRQGRARTFSKVVALSLAAGVALGGQVPAQAAPRIGQLPDITARESAIDYQNSEIVDKIGGGLVDVIGGANRGTSGGESGHITEPFAPEAGQLRKEFGAMGSHPVAATREAMPCDGVVYTIYNRVLRDLHGLNDSTGCYDVLPESANASPVGAQLIYPADIDSMESAPLMVLSPGIGTEPGMYDAQARLYASHGYVVALGYNFTNWFAPQMVLAASVAAAANEDESTPLAGKIDFSRTMLVGHSAGGGSAIFLNNRMDKAFQAAGIDMVTRGLVAINPGPSDAGLISTPPEIPSLVAIAEHEDIVPLDADRRGYRDAAGPAWEAVVTGSYHGTYLDDPSKNVLGSLVLSFSEYVLDGTNRAKAVYEGANYGLAAASELKDVQRKGV